MKKNMVNNVLPSIYIINGNLKYIIKLNKNYLFNIYIFLNIEIIYLKIKNIGIYLSY